MQRSTTTPDEFLESLTDDVGTDVRQLEAEISSRMLGLDRVLWEGRLWGGSEQRIIGYGTYRYQGSRGLSAEWFVVGLAVQRRYITVYVNAVEGGAYLAESYRDRLGKVKVGRSSISFNRLTDIDLAALLELVSRARTLTSPS